MLNRVDALTVLGKCRHKTDITDEIDECRDLRRAIQIRPDEADAVILWRRMELKSAIIDSMETHNFKNGRGLYRALCASHQV